MARKKSKAPESFDHQVHHRDPKSGEIIRVTPYSLRISKKDGDSVRIYERDGKKYYADGSPVLEKEDRKKVG